MGDKMEELEFEAVPSAEINDTTWLESEGQDSEADWIYRVVSTTLHAFIFVMGLVGNIVLIFVVYKSRNLHTPTYTYLTSLAMADLLLIVTAVPESIAFQNFGHQWLLGETGCALFIFLNFFGINAGSLSLTAFTVERYLVVCWPLLAQKICNLHRTRRIIVLCWIFTLIYSSPWLGLTTVRRSEPHPDLDQCELRLSKELYLAIFSSDLILFYLLPLLVAVIGCYKIARVLRKNAQDFNFDMGLRRPPHSRLSPRISTQSFPPYEQVPEYGMLTRNHRQTQRHDSVQTSKTQGLRMLVVTIVLFAVAWLPFRGLLIYNMTASEQWLDLWFLLFARTMIYLSAAMNPFLYNAINTRFRQTVKSVLFGATTSGRPSARSTHSVSYV
ncbi:hypothetical protein RvY_07293 [Ramazzottius varieornatus]|uniref:Thyrotropin-releasing hormone receptor n=1 Tax=Ramazzottius varieornatus TaxID=947166 RepID=A0A1D1V477_RAMVA|nr:hypothetical protein RvY_07293 [Ramazzottius varieornatus]